MYYVLRCTQKVQSRFAVVLKTSSGQNNALSSNARRYQAKSGFAKIIFLSYDLLHYCLLTVRENVRKQIPKNPPIRPFLH